MGRWFTSKALPGSGALSEIQGQTPATSATLRHEERPPAEVLAMPEHLRDAWEERAAIKEFDAGMSREEAEREAWADVIQLNEYRARARTIE